MKKDRPQKGGSPIMCNSITRYLVALLLALLVLGAAGCATVANGKYQQVPVVSNPSGATVVSDCGKGQTVVGETPVVAKISRKADRCVITLRKDGFAEESAVLTRHVSGWVWGNLFLPYVTVPGVLVDLYNGSGYRQAPAAIDLQLKAETGAPSAATR